MRTKLRVFSIILMSIPVLGLLTAMSGCTGMTCKNHGCSERELASNDENAISEQDEADRLREKMQETRGYQLREKKNQSN